MLRTLRVEPWGLRILGVDIDETFGLQQLIIQEVGKTNVSLMDSDIPKFIYRMAYEKGIVDREFRPFGVEPRKPQ